MLNNISRFFCLIGLICLAACSTYDGLYERVIPENVKAMDDAYIAAIIDGDKEAFRDLQGSLSDQAYHDVFVKIFAEVYDGDVVSQHVVGVHNYSRFATNGNSQDIESVFELKKGDGYVVIAFRYALDENDICCELRELNVEGFASSPYKEASYGAMPPILPVIIVLLLLCGIIYLYMSLRNERRNALGNQSSEEMPDQKSRP